MASGERMTIAIIGYGRMGKEVELAAKERGLRIGRIVEVADNMEAEALNPGTLRDIDVCIDFSTPDAVLANIRAVVRCGKNMVVGTTGWYDRLDEVKRLVKERQTGFLYAANFSLGVNIVSQVIHHAAHLLDRYPEYDIAITETHHRGKADSPSGTALSLGSIVTQAMHRKTEIFTETSHGKIKPHQVHVTSTRVGHTTGRHTVVFDSEADTIEIVHTAKNRRGYAIGALIAAEWLRGKKGFYTMRDVIS